MAVRGTVDAGAGGTLVTSVTGTANQITATPTTGAVVLSFPVAVSLPGSLAMPVGGAIAPAQVAGIIGTTAANNAAAGSIGEYISSDIPVGTPVTCAATNTGKNLTSIALTAGDWDVSLTMTFISDTSTTVARMLASTSLVTDTLDSTLGRVSLIVGFNTTISTTYGNPTVTVPVRRFSLAAPATIFGVGFATYAISTIAMFGTLSARRVR